MARALLQTINQANQVAAANTIIDLGTVLRRFGCNCRLSGNSIEVVGEGYYMIDISISLAPTAAGDVTVTLYKDGVAVPGATATGSAAVGDSANLNIVTTIRKGCCEDNSLLTLMLVSGDSTITNVSARVIKA